MNSMDTLSLFFAGHADSRNLYTLDFDGTGQALLSTASISCAFGDMYFDPTVYDRIDRVELFVKVAYNGTATDAIQTSHSTDFGSTYSSAVSHSPVGTNADLRLVTQVNRLVHYVNVVAGFFRLKVAKATLTGPQIQLCGMNIWLSKRERIKY